MTHLQPRLLLFLLCLTFILLPLKGAGRSSLPLMEAGVTETPDTTLMREVSINGQRQRISYRLDRQRIDAGQVLTAQGGTGRQTATGTCGARCLSHSPLPQSPHLHAPEQRDVGTSYLPQHRL